jgi:hypothetical protein
MCPFVAHLGAVVRRSVVDEYNLEIVDILMQHALNTSIESGFNTVYRYDDTQFHAAKIPNLFGYT